MELKNIIWIIVLLSIIGYSTATEYMYTDADYNENNIYNVSNITATDTMTTQSLSYANAPAECSANFAMTFTNGSNSICVDNWLNLDGSNQMSGSLDVNRNLLIDVSDITLINDAVIYLEETESSYLTHNTGVVSLVSSIDNEQKIELDSLNDEIKIVAAKTTIGTVTNTITHDESKTDFERDVTIGETLVVTGTASASNLAGSNTGDQDISDFIKNETPANFLDTDINGNLHLTGTLFNWTTGGTIKNWYIGDSNFNMNIGNLNKAYRVWDADMDIWFRLSTGSVKAVDFGNPNDNPDMNFIGSGTNTFGGPIIANDTITGEGLIIQNIEIGNGDEISSDSGDINLDATVTISDDGHVLGEFEVGESGDQSLITMYDENGDGRCMSCWSDGVCNASVGAC